MPVPPREQVASITAAATDIVAGCGFDLEEVKILPAQLGKRIVLVVDADGALPLDALAQVSEQVSEALDAADVFGAAPYTLEVTTPGVDRPLTQARHWRRAQGRKVAVTLDGAAGEKFEARVGTLNLDDAGAPRSVNVVVRAKNGPVLREVELAQVALAVVQVEFSAPDKRELALAGGVAAGKAQPVDLETGAGTELAGEAGLDLAAADLADIDEDDDEELDN